MSEVDERRKLRVNVCNRKVMRCLTYVNVCGMDVRLNDELLEEVDYFKYLWLQVATGGNCEMYVVHRINKAYKVC